MIELRSFNESDIDPIAIYANNVNVTRYMASRMPYPYTKQDAIWWVESGNKEQGLNYAIDLGGKCVGVVGVRFGELELQYSAVSSIDRRNTLSLTQKMECRKWLIDHE